MKKLLLMLCIAFFADSPQGMVLWAQTGSRTEEVMATVDGVLIGDSELERIMGDRLIRLRTDEYNAKKSGLEALIAETVLRLEASRRKVQVGDLVQAEVDSKVPLVEMMEARAIFEANKERYPGLSEEEGVARAKESLRLQRVEKRRSDFISQLKVQHQVTIFLRPPRVSGDWGQGPVKGSASAPVTIVAFSDFECPFCAGAESTLQRLLLEYPDKIRIQFKNFPLRMHRNAEKAAEAALCAGLQDRFWEMHDRLFANQSRLGGEDLVSHASAIGLDVEKFRACLDSGMQKPALAADESQAWRNGVNSTPTFFINGRMLVGAVPHDAFARFVEEELQSAKTVSNP